MGSKILQGMREAVEHAKGGGIPVRITRMEPAADVDVRAIRKRLGMSQDEFALRFGFSVANVRNWEQGHRRPQGSARVLLTVIAREPDAVQRALSATRSAAA